MDQFLHTLDALQKIIDNELVDDPAPDGLSDLCVAMENDLDLATDYFEEPDYELVIEAARINSNVALEVANWRICIPV